MAQEGIENEIQRLKTTRKVKSLDKLKQPNLTIPKVKGTRNNSEANIYFKIKKRDKEIEVFIF